MAIALGAVIIALLVLLLLYAGEYLGKAVAQLIPDLPVIGARLRDAVEAAAISLGHWASAAWDHLLSPVADLILVPVYAVKGWAESVVNAITALTDTQAWIVGTYVPEVAIGGASGASSAIAGLTARITADIQSIAGKITTAVATAEAYTDAHVLAQANRLTADLARISTRIDAAVSTAEAYADARVLALAHQLSSDLARVAGAITATLADAETYTDAHVQALGRTLVQDVTALQAAIAAAEKQAVTDTLGTLTQAVTASATATAAVVDGAVAGALDVAGDGFTDITAGLRSIDWAKVTDIAGLTVATGAVAATLARYLEQCGMPNCRNLSQYGRYLQDLAGDAALAALLAMLVDVVHDPEGAAQRTAADLGGVLRAATDAAGALVGA